MSSHRHRRDIVPCDMKWSCLTLFKQTKRVERWQSTFGFCKDWTQANNLINRFADATRGLPHLRLALHRRVVASQLDIVAQKTPTLSPSLYTYIYTYNVHNYHYHSIHLLIPKAYSLPPPQSLHPPSSFFFFRNHPASLLFVLFPNKTKTVMMRWCTSKQRKQQQNINSEKNKRFVQRVEVLPSDTQAVMMVVMVLMSMRGCARQTFALWVYWWPKVKSDDWSLSLSLRFSKL